MRDFGTFGAEKLHQMLVGLWMIHPISAGLERNGGKIVFRPGVHGEMRLGYGHRAAHAPRREGMKGVPDYFSPHEIGCLEHTIPDLPNIQKTLVITVIEVYENNVH